MLDENRVQFATEITVITVIRYRQFGRGPATPNSHRLANYFGGQL